MTPKHVTLNDLEWPFCVKFCFASVCLELWSLAFEAWLPLNLQWMLSAKRTAAASRGFLATAWLSCCLLSPKPDLKRRNTKQQVNCRLSTNAFTFIIFGKLIMRPSNRPHCASCPSLCPSVRLSVEKSWKCRILPYGPRLSWSRRLRHRLQTANFGAWRLSHRPPELAGSGCTAAYHVGTRHLYVLALWIGNQIHACPVLLHQFPDCLSSQ